MRKLIFARTWDETLRSGLRFRDQLRQMAGPEKSFIRAIVIIALGSSLLNLAVPVAAQTIINSIGVRTMTQPLVVLCLLLFIILTFSGVLQAIQTYTVEILQRRLFVRYGFVIAERMTHYQESGVRKVSSPDLVNRYFDVVIMQSQMVVFFVNGIGFIVQFLIGFMLLAFYHPYFLGFAGFMAQFLIFNWLAFGPSGVRAGSPEADGKYAAVNWVEEIARVRGIFTSERGRDFTLRKLGHFFNDWIGVRERLFRYQFHQHLGLQLFGVVMNVLILALGGFLVLAGELSAGQLVAAALVVNGIIAGLPSLQNFFFSIYNYSTSLDMIARFYDVPLEETKERTVSPESHTITFENFRIRPNYHFHFSIEDGTRNLIFVRSFSAMSLIRESLHGHVRPDEGYLRIGGLLQSDLDLGKLRDSIQVIEHDQIFSGTIRENLLALSGREFSETEILEALRRAGLSEVISSLPEGLETTILPNGYPLTRSQLLALQFVRSLLSPPRILIVTPDFEQISSYKRRRIFRELLSPDKAWTLLFFTQRTYAGEFDQRYALNRNELRPLSPGEEISEEVESHA